MASRGIAGQREFGGVTYFLSGEPCRTVPDARDEAESLRSKGLLARVIKRDRADCPASVYGTATRRR